MKRLIKEYAKGVTPPYSGTDLPHVLITFIVVVLISSGLWLLTSVESPITNFLFNKFAKTTSLPSETTPDLDVTYISRSPRYNRYCVVYSGDLPKLCGGTENQKRWPDVGETVVYKAHVMNKGGVAVPETGFLYKWLANGEIVSQGAFSQSLTTGSEATFDLARAWPQNNEIIAFSVEPGILPTPIPTSTPTLSPSPTESPTPSPETATPTPTPSETPSATP